VEEENEEEELSLEMNVVQYYNNVIEYPDEN